MRFIILLGSLPSLWPIGFRSGSLPWRYTVNYKHIS